MDSIDQRSLGEMFGFDITAYLVPDDYPDISTYNDAQLRAYHNGDWRLVGCIVQACDEDGNVLGEDSIWGLEHGVLPDCRDDFINALEDGPGFVINGEEQPPTFANGYGTDLVYQAVQRARQHLGQPSCECGGYGDHDESHE